MSGLAQSREAEARQFYNGAQLRALRIGVVLALVTAAFIWMRWGGRIGSAFVLGCLTGGLNTYWLARSTAAFSRKAVEAADPGREHRRPGWAGVLFQYVLRYLLIALAAYGIFKSSVFSILGFFAGLFLPVVSLMFEAFYEAWVSYRRGL